MKPIKYDGVYISPSQMKPWMLALQGHSTNVLYGLQFMAARPNGCACSEGFDPIPLDKMAEGAFYIDITPVPLDRAEMLKDHGPIVDVKLGEFSISYLGKERVFKDMVEAINHPYTLDKFSSVSIDLYANIWRVMGSRVGRIKDCKIMWQSQLIYKETIRPN